MRSHAPADIRPVTAADLDSLAALTPAGWEDIRPKFAAYLAQPYAHPVKLLCNNETAAVGCLLCHGDSAWLAHIIVAPACRRQGLGHLVVAYLLAQAEAMGLRSVSLIVTVLGEGLYRQYGFTEQDEYLTFQSPADFICPPPDCRLRPYVETDGAALLALDQKLSGERREAALRPALPGAFVFADSHGLRGFYLPELGEGTILAGDAEAGLALLALKARDVRRISLPQTNADAIRCLQAWGWGEQYGGRRMCRGAAVMVRLDGIYSRIGPHLG